MSAKECKVGRDFRELTASLEREDSFCLKGGGSQFLRGEKVLKRKDRSRKERSEETKRKKKKAEGRTEKRKNPGKIFLGII